MHYLKNIIIVITILLGLITFAQSETSWIKKKDKTETVKKVEKEKTNSWIKKKEVKENKKKLKEKIKESKSWITKKSKEKVKDIKTKLKKHKNIEDLPKADFYFAAIIKPIDNNEEPEYVYGYVKSDKNSKLIESNGQSFYSLSDGIAYFESKKNRCEVDSLLTARRSGLSGDVILNCNKNLKMSGGFVQVGSIGRGFGETSNGNIVEFEFFNSKNDAIAKLNSFKKSNSMIAQDNSYKDENIEIKPNGKYYALLIGNSNYVNWASLTSPKNDVNEIKKILQKNYEFEKIITVLDATRDKLFEAFIELSKITTDKDYVLIYYSGHGDIKGNQSYWIPVDGNKNWDPRDWINIKDLNIFLEEIPAHHLAVMVDSCYVGSKFKGVNMIEDTPENLERKNRAFKKLLDRRARVVLTSGSNEPVEDSGKGKHSIFALSFIESLKNNETAINLQTIGYRIHIAHAGMDQQPFLYNPPTWGHGGGDFIFIAKK